MDHRGVRGPEGHAGNGAPPEHTALIMPETDPPPWMWPDGQAVDPAWAAYWENQAPPPAANGAPPYTGQHPLYPSAIAPPVEGTISRNKEVLAFLIGVAAMLGIAILAVAGYLVIGRGGSPLVAPTDAVAAEPVGQETSVPTRVAAPTFVFPVAAAREPSAVATVGTAATATAAIATPTLAPRAQAPLTIPVILPPTMAASAVVTPTASPRTLPVPLTPPVNTDAVATPSAPAAPAVAPPSAVPAETHPSVPPTTEPTASTSLSPTPLSPFVPRPVVPQPAPSALTSPTPGTPLSPFVPRPAVPQPAPTTSPPVSTPAVLKTQSPGAVQPSPPKPTKSSATQG